MKKRSMRLFAEIGLLCACGFSCARQEAPPSGIPRRIVSLAPGITETLFALGLGERVIGVTTYCHFPGRADSLEKIGGYSDANLEKIIMMRPDLVVLSREHGLQRTYLERFHVRTLTVDNAGCAAICSSFAAMGRLCGATRASDSLIRLFREKLIAPGAAPDSRRPKVLFCVGRDAPGSGMIKAVYGAGRNTFYNDLLRAAGAENAFADSVPQYPCLSPEGILALAPDVIIDAAPAMGRCPCDLLARDWQTMDRVPAVRNKGVYCLSKDYVAVPGPRLLLLFEDIKAMIAGKEERAR
jgi:iron complex transport system substrate-binding protein